MKSSHFHETFNDSISNYNGSTRHATSVKPCPPYCVFFRTHFKVNTRIVYFSLLNSPQMACMVYCSNNSVFPSLPNIVLDQAIYYRNNSVYRNKAFTVIKRFRNSY